MVVYDLVCERQHAFEGWFDSQQGFESQLARGMVSCALCGSTRIVKRPAAPRLNISKHSRESAAPTAMAANISPQTLWRNMLAYIRKHSEDVGAAFPEEARKIHYGEAGKRNIRGQASAAEVIALSEEGIDVTPLPDLPALPEKLQ